MLILRNFENFHKFIGFAFLLNIGLVLPEAQNDWVKILEVLGCWFGKSLLYGFTKGYKEVSARRQFRR